MRDQTAVILLFAFLLTITGARAQESQAPTSAASPASASVFKGRLSPVPISADMVSRITGSGSVTAQLNGTSLTISGLFTGLQSPATLAHVHIGERIAVRGPAVFDVRIDKATTGSMSATLELSESQVASLRRGLFYVQVHSEQAAEGNIWGWLLPAGAKK
jgi:CHRD domain-containing protein